MDKERIRDEAEAFFEWPTHDKTHVTTTSMLIFAGVIAGMAAEEAARAEKAWRKDAEERDRFWRALHTISKYMTPRELETKSERVYGLPPDEATEYAYENVLNTAKGAIKGTRKPS